MFAGCINVIPARARDFLPTSYRHRRHGEVPQCDRPKGDSTPRRTAARPSRHRCPRASRRRRTPRNVLPRTAAWQSGPLVVLPNWPQGSPVPRPCRERTISVDPRPRSVESPPRRLVDPCWDCRYAGTGRWTRSPRTTNMRLPVSAPFQATHVRQFGNALLIARRDFRFYRGTAAIPRIRRTRDSSENDIFVKR